MKITAAASQRSKKDSRLNRQFYHQKKGLGGNFSFYFTFMWETHFFNGKILCYTLNSEKGKLVDYILLRIHQHSSLGIQTFLEMMYPSLP
jgi:hypothetical protein